MCGIICGVANFDVVNNVLDGLKRLEYRGYDSAGISVISKGELKTIKKVGKVESLANEASSLSGNIAISHTRWATHGPATSNNAHPQFLDNTAWVHNGIINNHSQIRTKLSTQGFDFKSDTDTEVMGTLFASILEQDPLQALQNCYKEFSGSFAWGLIDLRFQEKIFFATKDSPLVLGVHPNGHFLASDPLALLGVCDSFYFIKSGTIGWCSASDYETLEVETLKPVVINAQNIVLPAQANQEKNQKHYMLQEIYEQPDAVSRFLNIFWHEDAPSKELNSILSKLHDNIQMIQTIGCGSSYFASLIGKFWFNAWSDWMVSCDIASEFKDVDINNNVCSLLLALSQSGETADTISAFNKKQNYALKMSLCNVKHSTLARSSDILLPIYAGPEIGVASTKAFTNQMLALLVLSLAKKPKNEVSKLIKLIPEILRETIKLEPIIAKIANQLKHEDKMLFLGRGVLYPTALEGALKMKELSYIHAHAYPAGELKHGPLALIDDQLVTIGLLNEGLNRSKTIANFREIQARQGRLVVFYEGSNNDLQHLHLEHSLQVPSLHPLLSPFCFSLCLQLFAYHLANSLGKDVDQPRNLAKSVTVE